MDRIGRVKRSQQWLMLVAVPAFGLGLLIWALLLSQVVDIARESLADLDAAPTVVAPLLETKAVRTDCDAIAHSAYRSADERNWFYDNCEAPATATPEPTPTPVGPDRADCEKMRGTAYRSAQEREFYLANCIKH